MMITNRVRQLDRRALLRGAGGVAMALPFLEIMRPRAAKAAPARKRVVFSFLGMGTVLPEWYPTGTESDFTLSRILKPFEPVKSDMVVIAGLSSMHYGHHLVDTLSGRQGGQYFGIRGGGPGVPGFITLDQELANRWKGRTKFASLELGVAVPSNDRVEARTLSWSGPNRAVMPDNNVYAIYERIFGSGLGATVPGGADLKVIRARKKSVIDSARESALRLQKQLGAADRQRMDEYLESVRDIERQLDAPASTTPVVVERPGVGGTMVDYNNTANVPMLIKLQYDLALNALATDLTPVITIMTDQAGSSRSHTWIGAAGGWHGVSHTSTRATPNPAALEKMVKIHTWYNEQLTYFIGRLKATRDVDGTNLLDNMLVWQVPEYGPNEPDSSSHEHRRLPVVLAGRFGGTIRTNRYLNYEKERPNGRRTNQLMVSVLNGAGFPDQTFGATTDVDPRSPAPITGPLPGLL